ncbi:hypothetical protein Esti_004919 [Eimeria stiedai]
MLTPDPPYVYPPPAAKAEMQPEPAPSGRRTPPWEIARRIAFSPQISLNDPWRMNSDPNVADLAATMNPFVGLNLKAAAPRELEAAQQQQPGYDTVPSHRTDSGALRSEPVPLGLTTSSSRRGMASSHYSTHALTQHYRALSMGAPPSACLQECAHFRRQQVACVILALVASLGSLLLLRESFLRGSTSVLQKFGLFPVLLSGLTGAPLAYMCYLKAPAQSSGKRVEAPGDSAELEDPAMAFLSTRLTAQGFAVVSRSYELHADLLLNALLLPLAADVTRLLGLWYSIRMFRQGQATETTRPGVSRARCSIFGGGRQLALLLLVAVPVASVTLKQAFWSSTCLQSVTGKMMLVEPQPAVAALVLRCHVVLLAVAAALTGAVLAASLEHLSNRFSRKTSKIWGVLASLALLCCILFDVLAAAAPSGSLSSACTFYTLEAQSSSYAFKVFTTAATLARLLALLCLSFSASTFGLKDKLLSAALDQQPIDEAQILGVGNQ